MTNLSKANLITIKAALIAALTLLMLIPIGMVKLLINERENVKLSVKKDVDSKWGGQQELTGPILVLPYKKDATNIDYAYFLPIEFNIDGDVKAKEQSDGMYRIPCYQSSMQVSGRFTSPEYEKLGLKPEQIEWNDAFVLIGISDLQGIKNQIAFNWDGKTQQISSTILQPNTFVKAGLTIKIPVDPVSTGKIYDFNFALTLNGSDSIVFTPIGKKTHIHLQTAWKNATPVGNFLPTEQKQTDSGFSVNWDVLGYNRSFPQLWLGNDPGLQKSNIGINLQNPIDQYRQTMRAVKYAVMLITLTFVVFFLVELLSKNRRIHPIQYLLVSFALVLFYCLLLSISEYLSFGIAYLISSIAIITLITVYSHTIFKNVKQTVTMGIFISVLYLYLYVILRAESTSLLLGSIGLFIALASIMFVTRKIDWYKKGDNNSGNDNMPPAYNGDDKPYYNVNHRE